MFRYFHHNGNELVKVAAKENKQVCRLFTYEHIGGPMCALTRMSPYEAHRHPRSRELMPLRPQIIKLSGFADLMPRELEGPDETRAMHADHRRMTVVVQ